jgi:hypothetical protein
MLSSVNTTTYTQQADGGDALSEKHDAEEIGQILSVVRMEVPGLVKDLIDTVYSPESAEKMAKSVATFYKTLVDSGFDEKEALEMAKGFVIDFRKLFQGIAQKGD